MQTRRTQRSLRVKFNKFSHSSSEPRTDNSPGSVGSAPPDPNPSVGIVIGETPATFRKISPIPELYLQVGGGRYALLRVKRL